jgi:hypothetical protein
MFDVGVLVLLKYWQFYNIVICKWKTSRSNYYHSEILVWWLVLQLQVKFKFEIIFENEKVFNKGKQWLYDKT